MLRHAGMLVMRSAVCAADVGLLVALCRRRVDALEAKLLAEGHTSGLGGGDFSYAEVASRGRHRWDQLLFAPANSADEEMLCCGADASHAASDEALLTRVATNPAWRGVAAALLGDDFAFQVGLICSRPGAPAGGWHADGGHARYAYDGGEATDRPYALCAFVPLVDLKAPSMQPEPSPGPDADSHPKLIERETPSRGRDGHVRHGRGCTAFWPGSHRQPACFELGGVADSHLRAALPGAPLHAGDALMYDYRTVHCGSPNDAELEWGERPIVQITFFRKGYRDRSRNYGYHQLWD